MKQPEAADYCVGVVGAGAMGQGIAQVAIQGGMRTLLFDKDPGGIAAAQEAISKRLDRLVEKDRLSAEDSHRAMARLECADRLQALAPCDAVIEAVFEDRDVKRALFKEIEAAVSPDCLIASNTSSIPICSIARVCDKRDRIAGLHFFNPVPLMKLVEVIRAVETADATVAALTALGERMGRRPVTVKDSPGFLVNLGGRAYTTEALRIAHEGVATPAQVDAIMRDCRHFRMGPFELMDLTGIDVNYPVSQIVYEGYMQDPRIKTAPNHRGLYDAGMFGRKTGSGWYAYGETQNESRPSGDHETAAVPSAQVALAADDDRLRSFCDDVGLRVGADDGACPLLAAPVGEDATETALLSGADFRRLVCLDLSGDTTQRVTVMTAPGADPAIRDGLAAALIAAGRKVSAIKDSPGFVAQRMAAMVANLGCYMAEISLAEPRDIDLAMKLGLNYPLGPLELAEEMGVQATLYILERLQAATGEDRYRPTLWLKRRAALDLPIHTAG